MLISDEEYRLATELLDFSVLVIKTHDSDQSRRTLIINRAQSYKWSGENEQCLKILDEEDWSACSQNYSICIAVLRDQFDVAFDLMIEIGSDGEIKEHDYLDWPIFREFREQEDFSNKFKEVFGNFPEKIVEIDVRAILREEFKEKDNSKKLH